MCSSVSRPDAQIRYHSSDQQQRHNPAVLRPSRRACQRSATVVRRRVKRTRSSPTPVRGAIPVRLMRTLTRAPQVNRPPLSADKKAAPASDRAAHLQLIRQHGSVSPLVRLSAANAESRSLADRRLSLRAVSFVTIVLLPIAVAAVYLFVIAADQYVAEFRFSLSTVDKPPLEPVSRLN